MSDQLQDELNGADESATPMVRPWRWRDLRARAPLVPPALGLMAGIATDWLAAAPVWVYAAGCGAAIGALLLPVVRRRGLLPVVVLFAVGLGAFLHHNAYRRVAPDHIARYTPADSSTLARATGTVLTKPRIATRSRGPFGPWMYTPDRTSFLLDVESIAQDGQPAPASGRVRVTIKEAVMDLAPGRRVRLFGRLYRPPPPDNPGQFDWATWNRRHGVLAGMSCNNIESVELLESAGDGWWHRWRGRVRQRARGLLLDEMLAGGDPAGGLLEAMILAQRTAVDPSINEAFIRIGCAHYLAASGFHVGMLALFLYGLGRAVGLTKRRSAVCVVAATVFYAILAEPRPAIFRATVLAVAICIGLIHSRRTSPFNLLAISAIAFLVWRPTELFDVGFQLSYTCVAGILLFEPVVAPALLGMIGIRADEPSESPLVRKVRWPKTWRRIATTCAIAVAVALAAWASSLPLVVLSFQRFSPMGWLTSLLVFPLVGVVMCAGFAVMLAAPLSPWLATQLTPVLQGASALLLGLVGALGRLPGVSAYTSAPPVVWVVSYYAMLCAWVAVHRRAWRWPAPAAVSVLCVALTAVWLWPSRPTGGLTMTVLSVGRGTSVVIELPDGKAILYDAGCSGAYDPGVTAIAPFLSHRGISRLETAIVSHPNLDHFGGLLSVMDRVPTDSVMMGPQFEPLSPDDKPSHRLLQVLRDRETPIRLIDSTMGRFQLGGADFEVLWPPPDPPFELDANESSLVIRLTHNGQRILLTGDIGDLAQGRLLASDVDLGADVLLLPHHGGVETTTEAFVDAVAPRYLIQSSFRRTQPSIQRLGPILEGRTLFNTADDGAVQVVLGDENISVTVFRVRTATGPTLAGTP